MPENENSERNRALTRVARAGSNGQMIDHYECPPLETALEDFY